MEQSLQFEKMPLVQNVSTNLCQCPTV